MFSHASSVLYNIRYVIYGMFIILYNKDDGKYNMSYKCVLYNIYVYTHIFMNTCSVGIIFIYTHR